MAFHRAFGGAMIRPAGHALKLLGEAVELCFACGANEAEIQQRVTKEVVKQLNRNVYGRALEAAPQIAEIRDEAADVGILLTVLTQYLNIRLDDVCCDKLTIAESRNYKPDADGVLHRDRTEAAQ